MLIVLAWRMVQFTCPPWRHVGPQIISSMSSMLCWTLVLTTLMKVTAAPPYQSLADVLHFLSHASSKHPHAVKLEEFKLGTNIKLPLVTLGQINSSNTGVAESLSSKPVAVLVFGEHAREVITTEVAIWLIKVLIGDTAELLQWPQMQSAMIDAGVQPGGQEGALRKWSTRILEKLTLKVLPIESVDGRQLWEAGDLCQRKTRGHVDLNRNWPFEWRQQQDGSDEQYGGSGPFSEPHSRFLRDMASQWKPVAFVNVHSGEWAVYTPWDSRASLAAGLPADIDGLMQRLGSLCGCVAGPSGAVSGYLAYGTSMDWMFSELGVRYPLTVEVYGGGGEGKLKGSRNQPLSSFPVTAADGSVVDNRFGRRLLRGMSAHGARQRRQQQQGVELNSVMKLYQNSRRDKQACFRMFNPVHESDYKEVISRWVVMLLTALTHVAEHTSNITLSNVQ